MEILRGSWAQNVEFFQRTRRLEARNHTIFSSYGHAILKDSAIAS